MAVSNRTKHLPPTNSLNQMLRNFRYHEFSRQAIGILLVAVYGWFGQPEPVTFWVGSVIAIIGVIVRMYAAGYVVKNKVLCSDGPYSIVRHPLYTGNTLLIIGLMIAANAVWAWPVGLLFFWLFYPTTISYEDLKLHRLFGEEWERWSANIPALVPRSVFPKNNPNNSWSFMKSLKQNIEPAVAAWVAFWIYWLWTKLPATDVLDGMSKTLQ